MSWLYRSLIRPALFAHDSEAVHNRTLAALAAIARQRWARAGLHALYGAPE